MMKVPPDLENFIQVIKTKLSLLLGEVLFGIYLYGSLSYGDFEEHRSDVDIIVVIKRKLNNQEFKALKKLYNSPPLKHSRWLKRLEMDYVVYSVLGNLASVLKHGFKTTHFAHGKLHKEAESDGGNPINWINIRQCGIVLFGPSPIKFVPPIDKKLLLGAVRKGYKEIKRQAPRWTKKNLWHQTYMVVMLCRISCTLKTGRMVSKKTAVRWGIKNLPSRFRPMAKIALQKLDDFMGPLEQIITDNMPAFISYIENLFRKL